MNIEQLENHIVYLRKSNHKLRQALRRLLIMYSSRGDTDRVMELKQVCRKHFLCMINQTNAILFK